MPDVRIRDLRIGDVLPGLGTVTTAPFVAADQGAGGYTQANPRMEWRTDHSGVWHAPADSTLRVDARAETLRVAMRDLRVGDVIHYAHGETRHTVTSAPRDSGETYRGERRMRVEITWPNGDADAYTDTPDHVFTLFERGPEAAPALAPARRTRARVPARPRAIVRPETPTAPEADSSSYEGVSDVATGSAFASRLTFGIELECLMPRGRDHYALGQHIRTAAGVSDWTVKHDGSISGNGAEVVSPVLRGQDGLDQCRRVCLALQSFECKVNTSTGFHLHIGLPGVSRRNVTPKGFEHLRALCALWVRHESDLDAVLPPSRRARANTYCDSNRALVAGGYTPAHGETAFHRVMGAASFAQLMRLMCPNGRYTKLNLEAVNRHGTVEFRHHSGTVDADKVTNWIKLFCALVDKAAVARPRAWDFSDEHGQRDSLRRLLRYVRVGQDVQTFYMQRRMKLAREEGRTRATDGLGFASGRAA